MGLIWMTRLYIFIMVVLTCSCATATKLPVQAQNDGTYIQYFPPKTELQLTATWLLERCDLRDENQVFVNKDRNNPRGIPPKIETLGEIKARGSITVSPAAIADETAVLTFDPNSFKNTWESREVKIELTELGTLKSVNGAVADETATVITNVIKTVGGLFGLGGVLSTSSPFRAASDGEWKTLSTEWFCNSDTRERLTEVNLLKAQERVLRARRAELASASLQDDPMLIKNAKEEMEFLEQKIAAITAHVGYVRSEFLTLEIKGKFQPGKESGKYFAPTKEQLQKTHWFSEDRKIAKLIKLSQCSWLKEVNGNNSCSGVDYTLISQISDAVFVIDVRFKDIGSEPVLTTQSQNNLIHIRRPKMFEWEACEKSCRVVQCPEDVCAIFPSSFSRMAFGKTPISQWGTWEVLKLDADFAQKNAYSLSFDSFGRVTAFTWKDDSSAASVTGALTGITSELKATVSSSKFSEIDAEIASIEKESKYYQLQNTLREQRQKYLDNLEPSLDP